MKIKKVDLQAALEKVKGGLAQKELIEQSSSFIFMDGSIITYNDEVAVSIPMKALDFTCAVPGAELMSILSKVKDAEIEVSIIDNELVLAGAKFTARIKIQAEISLPIDTLKPSKWQKTTEEFLAALKMCLFSAGSDMSKPVLTCLHINNNVVESSDSTRLSRMTLEENINATFLLPARAATELCKYEIKSFALTDGWAHFKLESGAQFSCRTFEGKFPDFDPILQVENTHTLRFPPDMDGILERASAALIKDATNQVEIYIKDSKVTVTSASEIVRYEETARMRSSKDDITFRINPTFLRQILADNSTAELADDKVKKLKFVNGNFEHILALMK